MRIGIAQINPTTGDLDGNADKIVDCIRRARQAGCELVLTPETPITGYLSCDLLEVDSYVRANRSLLRERIVPETTGITAVVGFVDFQEDGRGRITRRYNAAALLHDGQLVTTAHKQNLCRYRYYDETRYFTPGRSTCVVPVRFQHGTLRLAVIICEDLWDEGYAAHPYKDALVQGADAVLVLNASPFQTGKWAERVQTIQRHQLQHTLPLLYANAVGIGDNLKDVILFDGRSMAFDNTGGMVACAPLFEEQLVIVELDDSLHGTPVATPSWQPEEELLAALTFALKDYCRVTGFKQAVLGVSGGVDSSLVAALATETLGGQNVLGVSLPSRYNAQETQSDSLAVCRNLGCEHVVMPIQELYQQTLGAFEPWRKTEGHSADAELANTTLQNFQARLRGVLLMGISNESGKLLLATGNKTEVGLGYCTLYGDMAGGLSLIGDLNKMDVYSLSRHINRRAGRELIPQSVLARVPSAELAVGQTDPFDYPVVAPLVDDLIARLAPRDVVQRFRERHLGARYPEDVYKRYDEDSFRALVADTSARYHRAAYKRSQTSPIVIVSRRALGFDLRETIINRWVEEV